MKLNIGCGVDIKPDFINLDRKDYGNNVVRDLRRGLPFSDNSIEYIYASNILEHVPSGDELLFVISECYRVLEPGGTIFINVPHQDSPQAFYPDHVSYWNESMVMALIGDGYQGGFKFELVEMKRGVLPYELLITLRKA